MSKSNKKKLIRVEMAQCIKSPYNTALQGTSMHYAFVGANEQVTDKGLRKKTQIASFVTCREFLCGIARAAAHPDTTLSSNIKPKQVDFDFTRLRLLIGVGRAADFEATRAKLFSGKRALNLLEEAVGWENSSVITTVKHEQYSDDKMWLLTGPAEWLYAPQLLSLVGLIMRLAHKVGPLRTDSLDDLFDHLKEISKSNDDYDYTYIAGVRKHILTIMEKRKMLFPGDVTKRYPGPEAPGWNGHGGITSFIKCATGDKELDTRVKNLVLKKNKVEKLKKH